MKSIFGSLCPPCRAIFLSALVVLSLAWLAAIAFAQGEPKGYVGTEACKGCHEKEHTSFATHSKMGTSFKGIARMKKGLTGEEIKKCYECHTTGYGKPGGFKSEAETPWFQEPGLRSMPRSGKRPCVVGQSEGDQETPRYQGLRGLPCQRPGGGVQLQAPSLRRRPLMKFNEVSLQVKIVGALAVMFLVVLVSIVTINHRDQRLYITAEVYTFGPVSWAIPCTTASSTRWPWVTTRRSDNRWRSSRKSLNDAAVFIFGVRQDRAPIPRKRTSVGTDVTRAIGSGELSAAAGAAVARWASRPDGRYEESIAGKRYLTVLRPMMNDNRCHHCHGASRPVLGGVMVRQNIDRMTSNLASLRNKNIIIGIGGFLIVMAVLAFLIWLLVIRPVEERHRRAVGKRRTGCLGLDANRIGRSIAGGGGVRAGCGGGGDLGIHRGDCLNDDAKCRQFAAGKSCFPTKPGRR